MIASISRRDLIRKFRALRYEGPFSGGKHQFMIRERKKICIPNPHGNADISMSLLKEILKQVHIEDSEWNEA